MNDGAHYSLLSATIDNLPRDLAFVGLIVVLLVLARFLKDLTTPFSLKGEMTARDNPAVGISVAGYYVGVALCCIGPLITPGEGPDSSLGWELFETGGYALLGILLLNASRYLVDKLLLRGFSTLKEIVEDRNVGTGAVEAGAYVASGLVILGALQGEGGGPHTALAFYALGQLGMVLYGWLYRLTCRYDLHGEIERDNVAAGVAFALNLVAIGLVSMRAATGDFVEWGFNLTRFGLVFAIGLVFLVALRYVVDALLLPGVSLHKEIAEDRNLNVAWVEGGVLAGVAGLLITII